MNRNYIMEASIVKFTVSSHIGTKIPIEIREDSTIEELKNILSGMLNIPADKFVLFSDGIRHDITHTISQCGINDGKLLFMAIPNTTRGENHS